MTKSRGMLKVELYINEPADARYPRRARSALGVDIVLTLDVCMFVCLYVCIYVC